LTGRERRPIWSYQPHRMKLSTHGALNPSATACPGAGKRRSTLPSIRLFAPTRSIRTVPVVAVTNSFALTTYSALTSLEVPPRMYRRWSWPTGCQMLTRTYGYDGSVGEGIGFWPSRMPVAGPSAGPQIIVATECENTPSGWSTGPLRLQLVVLPESTT